MSGPRPVSSEAPWRRWPLHPWLLSAVPDDGRRGQGAGCRVNGAGECMVAGDHVLRTVASTQMQMALWASASPSRIWPLLLALISEAKHKAHPKLDGEALVVVEPTSADAFRFDGSSFAPYLSSTALATGAPCGEAPTWLLRPSAINPRAEICTAPVYNFAILAGPSIESRRRARDSAGPKIKEDEVRERDRMWRAWGQGAGKLRRIGVKDTQVARRLFMRAASRQGDQTRAAVQQQPPSSADRCNPPATLRVATPPKAEKP
ncbi:hypothetical protein PaG_04903 [Moesziomyces aphidis]|uniref:Uncharacterized protein n=1 Tax=Moesziomyces aphidis TaxID=84754 RepID=W3VH41_MOEAP|nr:hypothetical protein PaG_04903 [Moesziomyces aphidis]